jgi:hypothetical protein
MIANLAAVLLLTQGAGGADEGYRFVPNTDRWVALRYDTESYRSSSIGKLDKKGNFLPDRRFVDVRGPGLSGAPPRVSLNANDDEPVYEYRSGRLIKGRIDKGGSFVPDLGEKVIRFEDYKPGEDTTRIYNLPGKFVPREKVKQKD